MFDSLKTSFENAVTKKMPISFSNGSFHNDFKSPLNEIFAKAASEITSKEDYKEQDLLNLKTNVQKIYTRYEDKSKVSLTNKIFQKNYNKLHKKIEDEYFTLQLSIDSKLSHQFPENTMYLKNLKSSVKFCKRNNFSIPYYSISFIWGEQSYIVNNIDKIWHSSVCQELFDPKFDSKEAFKSIDVKKVIKESFEITDEPLCTNELKVFDVFLNFLINKNLQDALNEFVGPQYLLLHKLNDYFFQQKDTALKSICLKKFPLDLSNEINLIPNESFLLFEDPWYRVQKDCLIIDLSNFYNDDTAEFKTAFDRISKNLKTYNKYSTVKLYNKNNITLLSHYKNQVPLYNFISSLADKTTLIITTHMIKEDDKKMLDTTFPDITIQYTK